ncbi:UNVERIFIED_CONTAM: hypothetical protein K2H54_017486 [Gekko kuhli]
MEVFQEVAAEMVTRGHNPTARECRAKAKDIRLKYKKAVTSNKRSGAGRKICSYYDQLNRILHKQKRVWIAQLLQATPPVPAQQASRIRHTPARQPGWQTAPAGSREAQEPRPSTSAQAGSKNQSSTEESSGDGDGNEDSAAESEPSHQHGKAEGDGDQYQQPAGRPVTGPGNPHHEGRVDSPQSTARQNVGIPHIHRDPR